MRRRGMVQGIFREGDEEEDSEEYDEDEDEEEDEEEEEECKFIKFLRSLKTQEKLN